MNKKENKFKKLFQKDGFYLVLFMCVCVVALTAVWVTKNSIDNLAQNGFVNYGEGELINEQVNDVAKADEEKEINLVKEDTSVATSTKSKENLESAKASADKEKETKPAKEEAVASANKVAILPVEGIIEIPFSQTTPVYSNTLEQFQLHKGMDIKADEGTLVKSFMNGTVANITNNDQSGMSITITHDNNMVSVYNGIKDVSVEVGQEVLLGDTIAAIGTPMITESEEGPHLHFEVLQDGKNIDPAKLIK